MTQTFASAAAKTALDVRTANGMKTLHSSMSANVDLFFQIGASRGKDITPEWVRAYKEDRVTALRTLAWSRDVRGGAGEREIFRSVLRLVEKNYVKELPQLVDVTPEFGRWDDLLVLSTDLGVKLAYNKIKQALMVEHNGLCAKWMPRKGEAAARLRAHLGLTPKGYRKLLVGLTKVVETQMCANDWDSIKYGHVPSLAAARYQKAFKKHDPMGYDTYKAGLVAGTEKVNASAVYPYDVIKGRAHGGDDGVMLAQWNALPNYIGDALVLPMCDVSGSMSTPVSGSKNLSCMDVCVSLGLYLADKNTGPFKDMFLTFSEKSRIEILRGNLIQKLDQLQSADWGMSTNLHSAFNAVLKVATEQNVAPEQMPQYILIMSDMQFNHCAKHDNSAMEMIERKFAAAGYTVPNIVFWNLNASKGQSPVTFDKSGAALISGFSPAIMTSVLGAKTVTPESIMLEAVNAPRYQVIV
jgi:hypothetical protein